MGWQLGPDVLEMLPIKPGERMVFSEGYDDGEGGHWVTHKPFPNIRRCNLEIPEFKVQFEEAIEDEQNILEEEKRDELLKRMVGTWTTVTPKLAKWRSCIGSQCPFKALPYLRGSQVAKRLSSQWTMQRPVEVTYL